MKRYFKSKAASAAFILLGFCSLFALQGCSSLGGGAASFAPRSVSQPQTVDKVDLERYLGQWFEVARLPNRFQDLCKSNVNATYSRTKEGSILVENRCVNDAGLVKEAIGEARSVDPNDSKLEVRFAPSWLAWLPMVWGDYWVLDLASDYSTALIGSPDRKFLWVLSRSQQLPKARIDALLLKAKDQGFDAAAVELTLQK
jgi:apolipoprotein D and lipocalin family protein